MIDLLPINKLAMPEDIHIRTLQPNDASALLEFELENRDWFERFVYPRGDTFYSLDGVACHIDDCLKAFAAERMHPCLILEGSGRIIGRGNLKDIDTAAGTTEIGYRIAQAYVGRGIASYALHHLMRLAYDQLQLQCLVAIVRAANPASSRVLEKAGFVQKGEVDGQSLDRYHYEHTRPMRT